MDKHRVAQVLEEIATLLELDGANPFRIRAYRQGARAIENLEEDLEDLIAEGKLEEVPGIGEGIGEKVATLVTTGLLPFYEKLKKKIPQGIQNLLAIPGLGPKKATLLYKKLKINSIPKLMQAIAKGKVAKLPGMGAKTAEALAATIKQLKHYSKRLLWWEAKEVAHSLQEGFSSLSSVQSVEVGGSFRRCLETVGDLDFVVASSHPEKVIDWFTSHPLVQKVVASGKSKSSVRLKKGMQVDLRVVLKKEFPFALMYFTGCKEHNIAMRKRALQRGYSLSEYGLEAVSKKAKPLPKNLGTEEAIFRFLGCSYIPPELREGMGEIEAASKHRLPKLIEEGEIRGVFHCHTTASDGHNSLEEMVKAAASKNWEFIGISDHSQSSVQANGMDEKRLFAQLERIHTLNRKKTYRTHIFAGIECDILPNGKLDFPASVLKELDYVIVSIHSSFKKDEKAMTARLIKAIENPHTTMVGHLTGRLLLKREGYPINVPKIIDACIANGKIIELNAHPMRLDMDWRYWHRAKEKGLRCAINPDAHSVSDLDYYLAGVHIARKGWLEKEDVINTYSLSKLKKLLISIH